MNSPTPAGALRARADAVADQIDPAEIADLIARIIDRHTMPHNGWSAFDAETGRLLRRLVDRQLEAA